MSLPITNAVIAGAGPVHLLRVLCEELRQFAAQYIYDSGRGLRAPVKVHLQVMPKPRQDDQRNPASPQLDLPSLLVYLMDGADTLAGGVATVGILVNTYSEQDEGCLDALNLGMAVRGYLLGRLYIGDKYRLLLDAERQLKWSTYEQLTADQRTHPYNYLHIQCSYQIPTLRETALPGGFQP